MNIGIYGYGELGRAVEAKAEKTPGVVVKAVFTSGDLSSVKPINPDTKVRSIFDILNFRTKIDVMIVCLSSAGDLINSPDIIARYFNTVDCFDIKTDASLYFHRTDYAAKKNGKTSLVFCGTDPGFLSLGRFMLSSFMPENELKNDYSASYLQCERSAVKLIAGVKDAVVLREGDKKFCYVSITDQSNPEEIEKEIIYMPYYFKDYTVSVQFVDDDFIESHRKFTARETLSSVGENGKIDLSLDLEDSRELTASVVLKYAFAVDMLNRKGDVGCKTVFDIPFSYLSDDSVDEIIEKYL